MRHGVCDRIPPAIHPPATKERRQPKWQQISGVVTQEISVRKLAARVCGLCLEHLAAGSLVFINSPVLHHEDHTANGGDVLCRIAIHRDNVSLHAGSDGAYFILHVQ
jgi:hypothetical protein